MIPHAWEGIPQQRNYPYNCWWVAAFGDDIGRSLLARWLLDTPVVLFRREDGTVAALEDRCPHRMAPLSIGRLQGDTVECGYHGFRFADNGRCVRVPTQDSPPDISVRYFPVREIGPLVWIYLGDLAVIDQVPPPPDMPWLTDRAFALRHGTMEIAANYMLLKENVLDLTHLGYVHASTFQVTDIVRPPDVVVDGDTVHYRQRFINAPLPAGYAHTLGLPPGTPWNRETHGSFLSPAMQQGATDLSDPSLPDALPASTRFAHATTPIDQSRMLYFWVLGRNHANSPQEMNGFADFIKKGFAEDRAVLEAVQALANRNPRRGGHDERSVKADAAGVQARRVIARWMARENAATA
ncbi:MAG: aromatic ring-hydroxylating dioxygenase subunit alpha [Pigmentiphaga sp.]|nr:aromatic ring-hydroxylating dioxygenase subunit alpha [Pigmentiphaga sp.]